MAWCSDLCWYVERGSKNEVHTNLYVSDGAAAHDVLMNFVQRWNTSHTTIFSNFMRTKSNVRVQSKQIMYPAQYSSLSYISLCLHYLFGSFALFYSTLFWHYVSYAELPKATRGHGDIPCQITRSIHPSYSGEDYSESSIQTAYRRAILDAKSFICILKFYVGFLCMLFEFI